MTKAGGALWIQVDPPVDAIVRIDVETGDAEPAVPGGHFPKSGKEGLWVVSEAWLAKIDAVTGDQILRIELGGDIALGEGAVWLMNQDGLYRVDPDTGEVGDAVGSGIQCSSGQIAVGFGSAWLACKEGTVVRSDVLTGESLTIPTAPGAHTFTVTDDAVWVTNYTSSSISHIDPATNRATQIEGAGYGVGITSGGGFVWAAAANGVAKIDPATKTIVDVVELGLGEYYELVWDDGIIWASTRTNRVLKVDPTK
jgi:streptogramin lyase